MTGCGRDYVDYYWLSNMHSQILFQLQQVCIKTIGGGGGGGLIYIATLSCHT